MDAKNLQKSCKKLLKKDSENRHEKFQRVEYQYINKTRSVFTFWSLEDIRAMLIWDNS